MIHVCMVCGKKWQSVPLHDIRETHGLCSEKCEKDYMEWLLAPFPKPTLQEFLEAHKLKP